MFYQIVPALLALIAAAYLGWKYARATGLAALAIASSAAFTLGASDLSVSVRTLINQAIVDHPLATLLILCAILIVAVVANAGSFHKTFDKDGKPPVGPL